MTDSLQHLRNGPVVRLRLHRPELHNAFDADLIESLTAALVAIGKDASVRVVVLEAAGASFSAGADLNWMHSMITATEDENRVDALTLDLPGPVMLHSEVGLTDALPSSGLLEPGEAVLYGRSGGGTA